MFNKNSNAIRMAALGAVAAGSVAVSSHAAAEMSVSAALEISNMYLYRGMDLSAPMMFTDATGAEVVGGGGQPVVAGDLMLDTGFGLYGGIWGSSGDGASGQEYDLYAGYYAEFGDLWVDLGAATYIYPNLEGVDAAGDYSEAYATVGGFGVSLGYIKNIAADTTYSYYSLGYEFGVVSLLYGVNDFDGDTMSHLDATYAFNDELAFTVSQVVDQDDLGFAERPLFKVSYNLAWDL